MSSQNLPGRFEQRLPQRIRHKFFEDECGCWIWTAAKISDGYGSVKWEGKVQSAHRVVYEILVGPIPPGLEIDHLCRVEGCVNPRHLEAVTHAENLSRKLDYEGDRTHCPRGHPFDEANTYVTSKGHRACRSCRREWARKRRVA